MNEILDIVATVIVMLCVLALLGVGVITIVWAITTLMTYYAIPLKIVVAMILVAIVWKIT